MFVFYLLESCSIDNILIQDKELHLSKFNLLNNHYYIHIKMGKEAADKKVATKKIYKKTQPVRYS